MPDRCESSQLTEAAYGSLSFMNVLVGRVRQCKGSGANVEGGEGNYSSRDAHRGAHQANVQARISKLEWAIVLLFIVSGWNVSLTLRLMRLPFDIERQLENRTFVIDEVVIQATNSTRIPHTSMEKMQRRRKETADGSKSAASMAVASRTETASNPLLHWQHNRSSAPNYVDRAYAYHDFQFEQETQVESHVSKGSLAREISAKRTHKQNTARYLHETKHSLHKVLHGGRPNYKSRTARRRTMARTTKNATSRNAFSTLHCYPKDASSTYNVTSCEGEDALFVLNLTLSHISPDFSWMLRNETKSRSGMDEDNILLQIKSNQYSIQSASTSSLCTYSTCLPPHGRYSLTLRTRNNTIPALHCPDDLERCYTISMGGEQIVSGGNFHTIKSHWFRFSESNGNKAKQWAELEQRSDCEGVERASLLSPTSKLTNFRFESRNFEMIQIFRAVSGPQLWASEDRQRAACWVIYDDPRQIDPTDPLLIQRYAMAVVYYATKAYNDDFHHKAFISSGNECDWFMENEWGDSCGTAPINANGNKTLQTVKHFHAYWKSLNGTIPLELASLTNLESIYIDAENVFGTLPSELGSLSKLKTLIVGLNALTGTIPGEFGKMASLQIINLYNNRLTGSIPAALFEATHVINIDFENNNIHGTLPSRIGELHSLNWIVLAGNRLSGPLPESLFTNCTKLTRLDLANNRFSGTITDQIYLLSDLEEVYLENNTLIGSLPSSLGRLSSLSYMSLNQNLFTGSIPREFGKLSNLVSFDAPGNRLGGSLPREMGFLSKLVYVDLSKNVLTGSVPSSLWNISFTTENHFVPKLDLHDNGLTGEIPSQLCASFSNGRLIVDDSSWMRFPTVKCSCCNSCNQGGGGRFYLEDEACSKSGVTVDFADDFEIVDTETNRTAYGEVVQNPILAKVLLGRRRICLPVLTCYKIHFQTFLDEFEDEWLPPYKVSFNDSVLYENDLTQILRGETQSGLQFGLSLQSGNFGLDKGHCDAIELCGASFASGSAERRALNHLSHFALSDDLSVLTGEDSPRRRSICWAATEKREGVDVEDVICNGSLVERYVLALFFFMNSAWKEHFDDVIPPRLSHCHWPGVTCESGNAFVTEIELNDASLVGTLPSEIGLLLGLKKLILHGNTLSGKIPDELPPDLKTLDLGRNRMTGTIPETLFLALALLEVVNLSNNLFGGTLPIAVGSFQYTTLLDMSDNFLIGGIPESLWFMERLRILDLSHNNLNGNIPRIMDTMMLETLSLHQNAFTGSIPTNIFSFPNLTNVWLHSNQLTGSIPTEIGSAVNLSSLTLSFNSLKGSIPSQLLNLDGQLTLLHLHGNQLAGLETPDLKLLRAKGGDAFIADCGRPYFYLPSELKCDSCTICCNSIGMCQENNSSTLSIAWQTVVMLCSVLALLLIACAFVLLAQALLRRKGGSLPAIAEREARALCGEHSVYSFLLSADYVCWIMYVLTLSLQSLTFSIFLDPADFGHENSDWQYSKRCPGNNFECNDENNVSGLGWFIFAMILASKLAADIVNGCLLVYKSCVLSSIRLFLSGVALVVITSFAAWTSFVYNRATATANTELVYNAVILLFVNELDEVFYALLAAVAPLWLKNRIDEMDHTSSTLKVAVSSSFSPPRCRHNQEEIAEEIPL